jgi:stage III sporulation protein AD
MLKLVAIAIVAAILIIYLKSVNSEYSLLATIAAGIVLVFYTLEYLTKTFDVINQLVTMSGIDSELYLIIFKITAIGYLVEFAADTVNDFGLKSLADKLVFAGKLIIFCVSMPIIYSVINMLVGLMK